MLNLQIIYRLYNTCSFEIILISISAIVSMWIPTPEFTTLQETVSKHFIKRESRDRRTVDKFARPRRDVAGLLSTLRDTTNTVYQSSQAIFWLYFQFAKGWNWFKANGTYWRWATPNISVNVNWLGSRPFTLNRWTRRHPFHWWLME